MKSLMTGKIKYLEVLKADPEIPSFSKSLKRKEIEFLLPTHTMLQKIFKMKESYWVRYLQENEYL